MDINCFIEKIFLKHTEKEFEALALSLYKHQVEHNKIYNQYVNFLGVDWKGASSMEEIAFLPAEFFKTHKVITGEVQWEKVFHSSGSTGDPNSKHYVKNLELYRQSITKGFELEYGKLSEHIVLDILPNYKENPNYSTIDMVE